MMAEDDKQAGPDNSVDARRSRGREPARDQVDGAWARTGEEILESFGVSADEGLDAQEVKKRRERYGHNRLRSAERRDALDILIEQFKSVIVALLAAAVVVSFAFGELVEGIAIGVVILINAAIGFVTELRAVRSMEALQELSQVNSKVRRDGQAQEVPAAVQDAEDGDRIIVHGGT